MWRKNYSATTCDEFENKMTEKQRWATSSSDVLFNDSKWLTRHSKSTRRST